MWRLNNLFFLLIVIVGCNHKSKDRLIATNRNLLLPSKDSGAYYVPFPKTTEGQNGNKGSLIRYKELDSSIVIGLSYFLFKMKEPVLSNYKGQTEIYRFTWLRTFDPPLTIRVQKVRNDVRLSIKMLNGASGYGAGEITMDTTLPLSTNQWNTFVSLVEKSKFWSVPNTLHEIGFDGATWVLEGVNRQNYHWVERWTPNKGDDFRQACQYLVSLSPINISLEKIY